MAIPFQIHATDYSNASGTALYDPFIEDWNAFFLSLLNIPRNIFPELRDSVGDWGFCPAKLFGAPIPITVVVRFLVISEISGSVLH